MLGVLHVFSHLIFKITLWDQGYNLYLQMSVCAAKETQILFGIHSFTHSANTYQVLNIPKNIHLQRQGTQYLKGNLLDLKTALILRKPFLMLI